MRLNSRNRGSGSRWVRRRSLSPSRSRPSGSTRAEGSVTGSGHAAGRLQRDTDAIHALGVTGVQARVTTSDGRHLVATSGVADRDTRRPVSPNGRLRIASTRKAFEATVVLQRASVIWINDLTRTRAQSRAGHRGA
ncbi:serine hydrolase [Micromonospora sp. NPDC005161]